MTSTGDTWALRTGLDLETLNLRLAELEAHDLLGITETDGRATAWFPAKAEGLDLSGEWERIPPTDWHGQWQARLQPVQAGPFRIAPPWKAQPGDLVIEPAQAFGTGHHETTTGCLVALGELEVDGRSVLDVGTGTGVLAVAAARLGAARVVGVDNDPMAVTTARDNAEVNQVALELSAGTVEDVNGLFDVVIANIDTATLCAAAGALVARVAPGGTLVASGVSVERAPEAEAAFDRAGLPVTVRPGSEWVVLTGTRAPAGRGSDSADG